jgi:hypothetical protein
VACIGCRGPVEESNIKSLQEIFIEKEHRAAEIKRKLRTFAAPAMDRHMREDTA